MTKLLFQSSCVGLMAGIMSVAAALPASALSFSFSLQQGGTSLTGEIRGLVDNDTSAATSFKILTSSTGFGVGEYVGNPRDNEFTVTNGEITSFKFFSEGEDNIDPAVTDSYFLLRSSVSGPRLQFQNRPQAPRAFKVGTGGSITFEPISDADPIPTPAMLPGLVGMGVAAYRKRKFAQADA